jgi:uncharacterized protein YceH (UPF0502 family)
VQLSEEGARVLGSLVEKALSTPQQYPLTLSALVAACNQTSNREPVVSYDEQTVETALHELKDLRLVRFVLPSHGRSVVRYRQVLDENLGLDARQSAVLAVLLLRGPQTVGELRLRTERMSRFDGLDEVQHELDLLGGRDEPLVTNVGRRPGQKEERWASLLVGTAEREPVPVRDPVPVPVPGPLTYDGRDDRTDDRPDVAVSPPPGHHHEPDQADQLRSEVAGLQEEVAELRRALDELRTSLGG